MGAEFLHAAGRIDRHNEPDSRVSQICESAQNARHSDLYDVFTFWYKILLSFLLPDISMKSCEIWRKEFDVILTVHRR